MQGTGRPCVVMDISGTRFLTHLALKCQASSSQLDDPSLNVTSVFFYGIALASSLQVHCSQHKPTNYSCFRVKIKELDECSAFFCEVARTLTAPTVLGPCWQGKDPHLLPPCRA